MLTNKRIIRIFIKFLISFSCLFVFMISHKTALGNSPKMPLTPQEQAWLTEHPEIRLGFNPHMEPLLIKGEYGSYDGIFPLIISELEKILGINITIEVDDWNIIVEKARKRQIDGLLACAPSQAEASSLLKTQTIHQAYPVAFTSQDARFTINNLNDLKGKSIAYQQEVKMLEVVLGQLEDDSKIIAVNSTLEAIRLVFEGKVEVAFGINFENYLVAKHALSGIKISYFDLEHANPISTCVRDEWPEFIDIFNKGLKHIGKSRIQQILTGWTNIKEQSQKLELTFEDRTWLDAHPVIRVGADSSWAPIEFLTSEGNYSGLSMDYLKIIEPMLGVRFEFVQESWQELITQAKQGKLDMFSCVAKTSEREKYLVFTEPYVEMPAGIFTLDDAAYISNLSIITNEKIAVVEGYAIYDFIVANYPDMNLVLVKTPEEGIKKVIQKNAFAFIDNSITTGHLISHKGYLQIRMKGEAPFVNAQRIGVRKDWPQLRSILQKSIDSISESERNAMYNRWVPVTYEKPMNYSLIWKIGGGFLFTVILFFSWTRKLKLEVHKRTLALQDSEEKFRALADTSPLAIYMSEGVEQKAVYVNPTFTEIFGYTIDEVPTVDDWWPLAYPDASYRKQVANEWQKKVEHAIETKSEIEPMEVIVTCKDGSKKNISWGFITTGKQNWACGLNMTDRLQAEKKLKASEERSRTWLEYSPVCTKVVDLDFDLQYMSSAGIKGLNIEDITEFYGKPYPFDFYPESFKNVMTSNLKKAKETGEVITQEAPVVDTDGSELWFNSTIVPVNDNNGRIEYIIIVSIDTTERHKAENEKANLENRLNHAQKMEAMGTLAGGIAHDFNNILAAILGYAEMARDDCQPGTTVAEDLDKVLEGGNRAKDLVQQILAFSRQSEMERIPLQPASVTKEAIKMLRPSLPTTIEINQDIPPATGLILADPTQIHQILMNLCTNAFHAMEETGGKLDISLKEVSLCSEDLIHEPDVEPGTFVQLSISDSGPGITPDIKIKIFDPYFTTKETGKGTGMGLAIVHGIVKSYGGFISLYSEPGEGTAFHVFIPVVEKELLPKIKDVDPIPIGSDRILFIDDEEILAEMGKSMLERLGYHVTVRNNSIEALETFQNQPEQFDLVITDQTMPGMTGADLARRMMQIKPEIPIILCTGYSTTISEEKAKSMGIKEFALKPLSKKDIAVLIRKVLDNSG